MPKGIYKHKPNQGFQKGYQMSEIHKSSISVAKKGKKNPKLSIAIKKKYLNGYINPLKNKKRPDLAEYNKKYKSEQMKGEKNPRFNNWSSREPYGKEFNFELKEYIRKKYNYRCQECFREEGELRDKNNNRLKLGIHHIDYNKKNNNENNLIPLCLSCHMQTNFNRDNWINYFKEKII